MTITLTGDTNSPQRITPARIYVSEGVGYNAEAIEEFTTITAISIEANSTKTWTIPTDLRPLVFSLTENTIQSSKVLDWILKNPSGIAIWDATIQFSDLTSLGGLQYFETPPIVLPQGYKLEFTANTNLESVTLLCKRCHLLPAIFSET